VGKITKFLAQVIDPRPPNKAKGHDKQKKHKLNGIVTKESSTGEEYITPRAEYLYYEVEVDNLATEYPESNERMRKWVCIPCTSIGYLTVGVRLRMTKHWKY
jgi:hypothetical protein